MDKTDPAQIEFLLRLALFMLAGLALVGAVRLVTRAADAADAAWARRHRATQEQTETASTLP